MFDHMAQARAFALGWQDGARSASFITSTNAERMTMPPGLTFDSVNDTLDAYRLGFWAAMVEHAEQLMEQQARQS